MPAMAAERADLPVVKPVRSCKALSDVDLLAAAAVPANIASATVVDTPAGQFCRVEGTIAPAIGYAVYLPVARWTQRYLQNGCGGLCGNISVAIAQAGTCQPALQGEFVVAANNMGHESSPGAPLGTFAVDPRKRIDFAYRANHATAEVAKALIQAFYGQAPRFSYFSGCSDGGREALMEAQRFPGDFDGISAGAAVSDFQVQNSFYHRWVTAANRRPDGSAILLADKLPLLHAAVIDHCDTLDGLADGLLADPRSCKVNLDWVACVGGGAGKPGCFTGEEVAAARRLYDGPRSPSGLSFWIGGPQPGSELQWQGAFIPAKPGDRTMSEMLAGSMLRYMIYPQSPAPDDLVNDFAFDAGSFARVNQLHPLNDALNTDLRAFAGRGGRLIMWHGWSDTSASPITSIAYYKAVQQQMGVETATRFLRLFMLPGTGHCGGGDGFSQIDTLTPLMAWVETGRAPLQIIADKPAEERQGPGGGLPGSDIRGQAMPLPVAPQRSMATRPLYPFPLIARYTGAGNPQEASSFRPAASGIAEPPLVTWYGARLLAPDNQLIYGVRDGRLVAGEDAIAPAQ